MDNIKKVKEIGELVVILGTVTGYVIKGVASVIKIVSNGDKPTVAGILKEVAKED